MKLQKKGFYLIIISLCFMILLINIPYADATTFSKSLNNYTFLDFPVIQGNEYYRFDASYINGYGIWNVYYDHYWCTLNNGSNYSEWSVCPPDSTKYYDGNSLIYNTEGTRTPYQGSGYYPGDTMLFNDVANFSIYASSGYSLGEAYAVVTFYDMDLGCNLSFSLDVGINF